MTAPNIEVAEGLANLLVRERLVACVNILPGMKSIYWWEGKVQREEEVVLIAKTDEDRYDALEKAVLASHPYQCPCIVSLPIKRANPAFADWITAQTRTE